MTTAKVPAPVATNLATAPRLEWRSDLPQRLSAAFASSSSKQADDAWDWLSEALVHGELTVARYAAVPYVVELGDQVPNADAGDLWITLGWALSGHEIVGPPIPNELRPAMDAALDLAEARGRVIESTQPVVEGRSARTTYTYDSDGLLLEIARPDGRVVTLGRDAAGRLERIGLEEGDVLVERDGATGLVHAVTGPDEERMEWTLDGSIPLRARWRSGTGVLRAELVADYDAEMRLASERLGASPTITYGYDADDLLTRAGGLSIERDVASGLPVRATLDLVSEVLDWSDLGELDSSLTSIGSSGLFEVQLERDDAGRVVRALERVRGAPRELRYRYDVRSSRAAPRERARATDRYDRDSEQTAP